MEEEDANATEAKEVASNRINAQYDQLVEMNQKDE